MTYNVYGGTLRWFTCTGESISGVSR